MKPNGQTGDSPVVYLSTLEAARRLRCSSPTVRRLAKSRGVGIRVERNRLVALTLADLAAIKPLLHETSGNPVWIASRGKRLK
jgi:hypothetical protein